MNVVSYRSAHFKLKRLDRISFRSSTYVSDANLLARTAKLWTTPKNAYEKDISAANFDASDIPAVMIAAPNESFTGQMLSQIKLANEKGRDGEKEGEDEQESEDKETDGGEQAGNEPEEAPADAAEEEGEEVEADASDDNEDEVDGGYQAEDLSFNVSCSHIFSLAEVCLTQSATTFQTDVLSRQVVLSLRIYSQNSECQVEGEVWWS